MSNAMPTPSAPVVTEADATAARTAASAAALARSFSVAYALERRLEGGYDCDPTDPGGATFCGVTLDKLAEHRGVSPGTLTPDDVRTMSPDEVRAIYAEIWIAGHADAVTVAGALVDPSSPSPNASSGASSSASSGQSADADPMEYDTVTSPLALAHMDWCVNGGEGRRATMYLQAAINDGAALAAVTRRLPVPPALAVDGVWGPRTAAAVAALDTAAVRATIEAHLTLRLCHYRLRACAGGAAERAQLMHAGLTEWLPKPSPGAVGWLGNWMRRLRLVGAACGVTPPLPPTLYAAPPSTASASPAPSVTSTPNPLTRA